MNSIQYTLIEEATDYDKNCDKYFEIFHTALNIHAPKKKKCTRWNNKPFVTKTVSKAIMQKTCFRNNFLKNSTDKQTKKILCEI